MRVRWSLLLVLSGAACARATGEIEGGEATLDTTPKELGSGTRWQDLYGDLFSATGFGACGSGPCHGPGGEGANDKEGIQCFDRDGCRASMIGKGYVYADASVDHALESPILGIIRHDGGLDDAGNVQIVGIMPKDPPNKLFSAASMDRIETWLKNGAPND